MKHLYFSKPFALLLFMACTPCLRSQEVEYLNANNLNVGIGIGGNLFSVITDSLNPGSLNNKYFLFEAPKGSGIHAIATASLWLSGTDQGNNQHCALQVYKWHGGDFFDGPIVNNYDAAYDTFYRRVFKITKQKIIQHQTLNFPVLRETVDSTILKWPGKGNAWIEDNYGVTIAQDLAHFIDANANGIYDPWNGDYPALCGDEGIFFVFNDARFPHLGSGSIPLGVEVRGMAEAYFLSNSSLTKDPLNNSIFVTYEIENKSSVSYHDFYMAEFEDAELGCYVNDKMGCDTVRNLMFAYNFIAYESPCSGEAGYQNQKVSIGTLFPKNQPYAFGRFLELPSMENSDPTTCADVTNYMQGKWKDGLPFTEGGTGYGGSTPTTYLFTGNPSDSLAWRDSWPFTGTGLPDRRMYSSFRSATFDPGEIMPLPMVFIFANDSSATHLTIVDSLKQNADTLQSFYNVVHAPCGATNAFLGIVQPHPKIGMFPNPASEIFMVESDEVISELQLYDMSGQLIFETQPHEKSTTIYQPRLAKGLYLVKLSTPSGIISKKLVIHQ